MNLAAILVVWILLGGSASRWQEPGSTAPQNQPPPAATAKTSASSSANSSAQAPPSLPAAKPAKASGPRKKKTTSGCPAVATQSGSSPEAAKPGASGQKPCPPPKVVVRNGGSNEPAERLKGDNAGPGSTAESTEDLMAGANGNLETLSPRELNPSERDAVSQIQEFIKQAKAAVAAGDLERGHALAVKARLLSEELVKP